MFAQFHNNNDKGKYFKFFHSLQQNSFTPRRCGWGSYSMMVAKFCKCSESPVSDAVMGFKFGLKELTEHKCQHGEWFSREVWWRRPPRASSRFVQTQCPAMQRFVSCHQTLLTNYNCNYGQEERKRKGNSAVFSNSAHESTKPLQTQVWIGYMGSPAEQKPFLKVRGKLPWRKGIELSRRKIWNTAKLQETPWKRFFHSCCS